MSPEVFVDIFQHALFKVMLLVTAIIVPSLLVGLVVAIFQAATSINEQTLSFLPRFIMTIVTLVIGAPHMNTNLTKYYTTRPSLGCILKVGNGRFVYDKDSLYNKQAPESYKTKSAEGDECEYFYIPFYQVKHTFSLEIPTDSENVVFGNYPEYGAAHLLAAL